MTIVHVYQQRIRRNIKAAPAEREPPIIVRDGRERRYGNAVEIKGPCRLVYSPDKPLDCGARLWIETEADVVVLDRVEALPRPDETVGLRDAVERLRSGCGAPWRPMRGYRGKRTAPAWRTAAPGGPGE